jgi:putative tricarboxylic transport membrane protein
MSPNLILGSVTLAVSVVYYWMAAALPVSRLSDSIGPQGLPKVYAVVLAALSLVLIAGSLRGADECGTRSGGAAAVPRAAGTLFIGVAYVLIAPYLGYMLSITALILATTYYQGGTLTRYSAFVALAGGVLFWVLFVVLMGIAQPAGIFPPQI